MSQIYFTPKERTVKDKTVSDAFNAAQAYLMDRHRIRQVCTNCISRRDADEKITVAELNDIAQGMIDDTLYYGGNWM